MEKIRLIEPSLEMKKSVMEFRNEFISNNENSIHGGTFLERYEDYRSWLALTQSIASGEEIYEIKASIDELKPIDKTTIEQKKILPSLTYLAFRLVDNTIVGITSIRPYLTAETLHYGHIGFSVRPSERKKGYATEILRLTLGKSRELGVIETYVACYKNNAASRKVIRKNGLEKVKEIYNNDGTIIWLYKS